MLRVLLSNCLLSIVKSISLAVAVIAFALPVFARTETLSHDTMYDDVSLPLAGLAYPNGVNGLMTKGYTTLRSLPTFPNIGGVYTVTGWNPAECGTCYQVTHGSKTNTVLAADVALEGFSLSEEAMSALMAG